MTPVDPAQRDGAPKYRDGLDAQADYASYKDRKLRAKERDLGLEPGSLGTWTPRGVQPVARMADCPEHGLHGERDRCFNCDEQVRRPVYVALRWLVPAALVALALAFLLGYLIGG